MANPPYAPRSPDLSAFHSYPPQQQQQQQQQQPPQLYHRESFSLPTAAHSNTAFYNQDPVAPNPYAFPQHVQQQPQQQQPPPQQRGRRKQNPDQSDPSWFPEQTNPYASAILPRTKQEDEVKYGPAPGEVEGIVVKTKFPVARIKRIVQADEDVGKVAQVTPVVVSKALELFMISLALKSADEARTRGSKRVTGFHLKQVVQKDEQFDFLSDIMAKVPDAPTSSGKGKKEDDDEDGHCDDDDEDTGGGGGGAVAAATPAKRGKGGTRGRGAPGGGRRKRKEREDS